MFWIGNPVAYENLEQFSMMFIVYIFLLAELFSGVSLSPKVATTIGFGVLIVLVFLVFGAIKVNIFILHHFQQDALFSTFKTHFAKNNRIYFMVYTLQYFRLSPK